MNIARPFQLLLPNLRLGGRYQVVRRLGVGGFSETFLAKDIQLPGKPYCVIKQLKPRTRNLEGWRVAKRLFDAEAEVLYRLGNHDRIPRLLAHFEENRNFYLVQELIVGASLRHQMLSGQPWPESRVVVLVRDILQVLTYVHGQNVIHRDIKPSNLICRRVDGRMVLIDFGAVKQVSLRPEMDHGQETNQPSLTISIGTLGYMPMEQSNGMPRFNSDIYAVGMIGIEALTGMRANQFQRDSHTGELIWREVQSNGAPLQVSQPFGDILEMMVSCHFKERYQTVQEVLEAIDSLLSQSSQIDLATEFAALAASSGAALSDLPNELSQPSHASPQPESPSSNSGAVADPAIAPTVVPSTVGFTIDPAIASTIDPVASLKAEQNADPAIDCVSDVAMPEMIDQTTAWADDRTIDNQPIDSQTIDSQTIDDRTTDKQTTAKQTINSAVPTQITPLITVATQKFVALQDWTRTLIQHLSTQKQTAIDRVQRRPDAWRIWLGVGGLVVTTAVVLVSVVQSRSQSTVKQSFTPFFDQSFDRSLLLASSCREPSPPNLPSRPPDLVYLNGTRYYGPLDRELPANSRGIMVFPSGNRYDGELKSGKRNGCGTYTFANGRRYVGQFQNDAFQGQGMWSLENGDQYVGTFQVNRCHGTGIFIFHTGTTQYGNWRDGQLEGTDLSCDR